MNIKKAVSVLCIALMLISLSYVAISAGSYNYGSYYIDSVSTTSSQNLPKHSFNRIDIGASNINITTNSGTPQYYHLSLYTKNTVGIYTQFGNNAACCTTGTGGLFFWQGANPSGKTDQMAYIKVVKETSGGATLSGTLKANCRTYVN